MNTLYNIVTTTTMCLCALVFLLVGTQTSQAQNYFEQEWDKHDQNPLFSVRGDSGSWNDEFASYAWAQGHVMYDGENYRYYKGGFDGFHWSIGFWTSSELETGWSEYEGNPIITEGVHDSWNEHAVGCPTVIKDGDTLKMWYAGMHDNGALAIGYATSMDGVDWTEYEDNPVMTRSRVWESSGVYAPCVIKSGDDFQMWYSGQINNSWTQKIGYASSEDGIRWNKSGENPILSPGEDDSWNSEVVFAANVYHQDGEYLMWFGGAASVDFPYQIGFAYSEDGVTWTEDPGNPVLINGEANEWDQNAVIPHGIFPYDTTFQIFYAGLGPSRTSGMGLATLTGWLSVKDDVSQPPSAFILHPNYPNPFNSSTTITYGLPFRSQVAIRLYDLRGRLVTELFDGEQTPGMHSSTLNAVELPSGLYFVRLEAAGQAQTRKVMLVR